jgi:hypothetical protein
MRAEPPGKGACLRCYNSPEPFHADDDLRAQVRAGGAQAPRALAEQAGVSEAAVRRWLDQPGCDEVGDGLLATLRREVPESLPRFAAGFTSAWPAPCSLPRPSSSCSASRYRRTYPLPAT